MSDVLAEAIPPQVHSEIMHRLRRAEIEHGVRILLAVESGSRAWGFASPNSDYDVRFIYARPKLDYLAVDLEARRDVIEYPIVDDIDLNGWDLRKALALFWRSNPGFIEWIQSPIVYVETGAFAEACRALLPRIYSPPRGVHHYLNMARNNYRGYLRASEVPLKKYLYVLRPLLAIRWLERTGAAAPIEFHRLLGEIAGDEALLAAIDRLLALKRAAPEMGLAPPIAEIDAFIGAEFARHSGFAADDLQPTAGMQPINQLFRSVLEEAP